MKKPSDDTIERILSLIRGGAGVEQAASYEGLDPREFSVWLSGSRQKAVRLRVQQALAQADLTDEATIKDVATGKDPKAPWQVAKARLESRQVAERERELHRINALALGR